MNDFPIGSLVILRSGGPVMTVDSIREDGIICTIWFVDDLIQRDAFDCKQLIRII